MYYTLELVKFHSQFFLYVASILCPHICTVSARSLTYLSFLKLGLEIVTYIEYCVTCGCIEGNFANQIHLNAGLLFDNFDFLSRLGNLFFNYFDQILHNTALASFAIKHMNIERPEEILCFNIDLPIIHSFQLFNRISILMLTNGLNFKQFLICVGYFYCIFPLDSLWSDFAIFASLVYIIC